MTAMTFDGSDPDRAKPKPGDIALCVDCGNPSVVAADGSWRRPLSLEMGGIMKSPNLGLVVRAARLALEKKERGG